jgi:hypothetical protein
MVKIPTKNGTPDGDLMTRPRAADDFATIRARMEELRRERDEASADDEPRAAIGPRPYAVSGGAISADKAKIPLHLRRLFRTAK